MTRTMPATYAEPRPNTAAHTAWERGFTFAEWRALPRSERMAEVRRADGHEPTDAELANLRLLDGPTAELLAALRAPTYWSETLQRPVTIPED
jgi:hypothetical protein